MPAGFSASLSSPGLRRLARRLREAKGFVAREMRLGLERSLAHQTEETRRRTPIKSGALKDSIEWRIEGVVPALSGSVFSALDYAAPVETGSRPHVIRARRRRFLRFRIGDRTIYTPQVAHPGARGRWMFRDAARATRGQTTRFLAARLGNVTRLLGRP